LILLSPDAKEDADVWSPPAGAMPVSTDGATFRKQRYILVFFLSDAPKGDDDVQGEMEETNSVTICNAKEKPAHATRSLTII
jgi:hypothetical protein